MALKMPKLAFHKTVLEDIMMSHKWLAASANVCGCAHFGGDSIAPMLAAGASAATFVVHNTTELETAVTSANGNSEANTIELTAGTYLPGKTLVLPTRAARRRWRGRQAKSVKRRLAPRSMRRRRHRSRRGFRKRTDHRQGGRGGHAQARCCHEWWQRRQPRNRRWGHSERRKRDDLRQPRQPDQC